MYVCVCVQSTYVQQKNLSTISNFMQYKSCMECNNNILCISTCTHLGIVDDKCSLFITFHIVTIDDKELTMPLVLTLHNAV